jgi:hypothetical protein
LPSARIASGATAPGAGWQQYGNGVTITVDTSAGRFATTPNYVVSLGGPGGNMWLTTGGASSVYEPTATSFKMYLKRADDVALTLDQVQNNFKWYVTWIGMEN